MLRWFLLILTLLMLALGSLTVVKAPDWSVWQLAVLAGEFGHWLAIVVLFLGLIAWWLRGDHSGFAGVTVVVAVLTAGLFLKPAFQAWQTARDLPDKLAAQFPDIRLNRNPFSVHDLFLGQDPAPVPLQTLTVTEGLPLDLYRTPFGAKKRGFPCVVIVHGGGWQSGDRREIPELNHWLARRGYAVAAISYRLAPKFRWPAQRDDVLAAIAYLKANASDLGLDPTRFVLLGRSAGGQIALTTAYTADDPAIRGVVGLYAPSDLSFGYAHTHEDDMLNSPTLMRQYLGGPPETARENYDSASAFMHVNKGTPPTLLLHGTNDPLVWDQHSVRLAGLLGENKVRCVFVPLPWATHAFEFNLHGPGGQITLFALEWFLDSVTK